MSPPVFLADPGDLDALVPGDVYWLRGPEAHHASVQRLAPGDLVDIVDTVGVRLHGTVAERDEPHEAGAHESLAVEVVRLVREPAGDPALVLVQALAKGDRDERAVEAATEVGVDRVVPWQAHRAVVVWRGRRAAKSHAAWVSTVRAAAKQSRRAWVPPVADPVSLTTLTALVASARAAGGLAVVLDADAAIPLASAPLPLAGDVVVIVGPEGGIAPAELGALTTAGALPCRLGPHILRTSTAGPVALALLAQRLGRWT
ncbi:MAG: 16S rRNA (uracil(1498)-N(3))-methyltransferase [Micrococcales bacterium]|nr:16S rRNA (uracil(1498)-N(3))-methyltransferase [Micrococcales bacterium]MCL2666755.1 16S rRNA (uracil(1498)-N(3))-methyltransferase [Micrococcales bacterium]